MSDNPTFEDALNELEDITAKLEGGDLSLEESLTLFERGQQLAAVCNSLLDSAELRLVQIGGSSLPPIED